MLSSRTVTLALAALLVTGGCSQGGVVTQSELEKEISVQLGETVGTPPDDVECPEEGLEAEVGATQRCVLTAGEDRVGLEVEVTSVEGDDIGFDIQVDEEVME